MTSVKQTSGTVARFQPARWILSPLKRTDIGAVRAIATRRLLDLGGAA